jgi:hypothetical protein
LRTSLAIGAHRTAGGRRGATTDGQVAASHIGCPEPSGSYRIADALGGDARLEPSTLPGLVIDDWFTR